MASNLNRGPAFADTALSLRTLNREVNNGVRTRVSTLRGTPRAFPWLLPHRPGGPWTRSLSSPPKRKPAVPVSPLVIQLHPEVSV